MWLASNHPIIHPSAFAFRKPSSNLSRTGHPICIVWTCVSSVPSELNWMMNRIINPWKSFILSSTTTTTTTTTATLADYLHGWQILSKRWLVARPTDRPPADCLCMDVSKWGGQSAQVDCFLPWFNWRHAISAFFNRLEVGFLKFVKFTATFYCNVITRPLRLFSSDWLLERASKRASWPVSEYGLWTWKLQILNIWELKVASNELGF